MRKLALLLPIAFVFADTGGLQRDVRTKRFATAVGCQTCHSNADASGAMRDNQGRGIAPHDLWRSSMMANAARDPFFRAVFAAQKGATDACMGCHAPMAAYESKTPLGLKHLDEEFEEEDADVAAMARDGASCTFCHQIQPGGKPNAGFKIGEDREIFGPFDKVSYNNAPEA